MIVDMIVAGGGPAGLATATYARRAGMTVVVLEPRSAPIDKACGEGLMPGAVAALGDLGVVVTGWPIAGITYRSGPRVARADFRAGRGLGVRRTTLARAMTDVAIDAGAEVKQHSVGYVGPRRDGVLVDDLRARWLVAADGLHSPIRRRLGLERRPLLPRRYGQRAHFGCRPWSDHVEVHWARDVEAYVTPVDHDLVGVAVLSAEKRGFADHLAAFPELLRQLGDAPRMSAVRGAGPLAQRASRRVAGRVLVVGDAAGYVDALTGEGIALAVTSARALVESVVADDGASYERRWRAITRDYRLLTSALVIARGPAHLGRAVVPLAHALPGLFDAAVNRLAQPSMLSAEHRVLISEVRGSG